MYKTAKGLISAILAAAVAATPLFGSYTNAESSENAASMIGIDTASEAISSVLSEKDIPECLALEVSKTDKFAAWLYDKETALDTVLFANKDGSETVYIFNEDVKYIDENGMIADKSNKLYSNIKERAFSSDYSYVNKKNDINTYFPKSLKTDVGVSVEAQGQVIEMYPLSDVVSMLLPMTICTVFIMMMFSGNSREYVTNRASADIRKTLFSRKMSATNSDLYWKPAI